MNWWKDIHESNSKMSQWVHDVIIGWAGKYKLKNQNYGASWLLAGQTISLWFPEGLTLNTPKRQVLYGVIVRMLDKMIRAANLTLTNEEDKVGETASETFFDLGVYAFMAGVGCFMGKTREELVNALRAQSIIFTDENNGESKISVNTQTSAL